METGCKSCPSLSQISTKIPMKILTTGKLTAKQKWQENIFLQPGRNFTCTTAFGSGLGEEKSRAAYV